MSFTVKYNNACQLAELAAHSSRNNHARHSTVEDFMLINDSSTIAVEVPSWLYERSLDMRLNGHIDMGSNYKNGRRIASARKKIWKIVL